MSYLSIKNVKIKGMSACVPQRVEENRDYTGISKEEIEKYIAVTGVERRHCAIHDGSLCSSDLCYKAAEKLISDLGWDKSEIGAVVYVSQTSDYLLPQTACILQNKLGLSTSCLALDIKFGCPGFLAGLGVIGSLLSGGTIKKALLMVGNTQSEYASPEDRAMYLLLGDAGTVTALEYNNEEYDEIDISYLTDGSMYDILIVPDGGSRNPVNANSFVMEDFDNGIKRTRLHEKMDGESVFSSAIRLVPRHFNALFEKLSQNKEELDYLLIHQANKFLCEKLRKKIGVPTEKVPYNINEFGNTSGATLPLLMVTNLQDDLANKPLTLGLTAMGVGFAMASARIKTKGGIICSELMYL